MLSRTKGGKVLEKGQTSVPTLPMSSGFGLSKDLLVCIGGTLANVAVLFCTGRMSACAVTHTERHCTVRGKTLHDPNQGWKFTGYRLI